MEHRPRYALLDSLRGLTLLSMIAYHAVWDLVYLYHFPFVWYLGRGAFFWQQSICWTFILLAGFCWPLGRRPLRRGLTVLAGGALVSLVTRFVLPDDPVRFGVLTLLGASMLLAIPLDRVLRRIPAPLGLAASFALFTFGYHAQTGVLSVASYPVASLPAWLYRNALTAFLGFPYPNFHSSDYFPLVPWFFLFLCGYFLYRLTASRLPDCALLRRSVRPLAALGRHSLLVYLLHQPILYVLFAVLF